MTLGVNNKSDSKKATIKQNWDRFGDTRKSLYFIFLIELIIHFLNNSRRWKNYFKCNFIVHSEYIRFWVLIVS